MGDNINVSFSAITPTPPKYKLNEQGELTLPNGRVYKLDNLTIGGKAHTGPLSKDQLVVINDLLNQGLIALGEDTLKKTDINKFNFNNESKDAESSDVSEITAQNQEGKVIKSAKFEQSLEKCKKLRELFLSSSSKVESEDVVEKEVEEKLSEKTSEKKFVEETHNDDSEFLSEGGEREDEVEINTSEGEKESIEKEIKSDKKQNILEEKVGGRTSDAEKKAEEIAEKTDKVVQREFVEIARGKAKVVHKEVKDSTNETEYVYYTPVPTSRFDKLYNPKKVEIEGEYNKQKKITEALVLKGVHPKDSNLVLDLEILPADQRIDKQFTVKTEAARSDLSNLIRKNPVQFPLSAKLGLCVINGMKNLHAYGVHGDLKDENVLVYGKEPDFDVKISDFGKTRSLNDESVMHTGNPRYAPPEGRLSKQGEVYSTGIMLIRLLEGEFIDERTGMLISKEGKLLDIKGKSYNPEDVEVHESGALIVKSTNVIIQGNRGMLVPLDSGQRDPKEKEGKAHGIEKFLVLNKNCLQTSAKTIKAKVRYYAGSVAKSVGINPNKSALDEAQNQVTRYIVELDYRLYDKYGHDNKKLAALEELSALLVKMTQSDPSKRPTMKDAATEYKSIMDKLQPT